MFLKQFFSWVYIINRRKSIAFFFLVEIFANRVSIYLLFKGLPKRYYSLRDAVIEWNAQRLIVLYVAYLNLLFYDFG